MNLPPHLRKDIDYQKKYWLSFAENADKDILSADLHASWSKDEREYTESSQIDERFLSILREKTELSNCLDFGVGMGRNFKYLRSKYGKVIGYDTPPMVEALSKKILNSGQFVDDWHVISQYKFDLVYESVVMQHIPPQDMLHKLLCIAHMSPYFYSDTRCYNDFFRDFQNSELGINMASLVESTNVFELVESSILPEDAKRKMDETHYQVLYKSKIFIP